jgi:hypothetical protein
VKVNDDAWHRVEIRRKRRLSFLQVDDFFPQRRLASPGASTLNSNGKLWIGQKTSVYNKQSLISIPCHIRMWFKVSLFFAF